MTFLDYIKTLKESGLILIVIYNIHATERWPDYTYSSNYLI